jgi:hypothetical protein
MTRNQDEGAGTKEVGLNSKNDLSTMHVKYEEQVSVHRRLQSGVS